MKKIVSMLMLAASLIQAQYSIKAGKRARSRIDHLPTHHIADMKKVPQNTSYYATQLQPISASQQKRYDKKYNKRYFAPWSKSSMGEPKADLDWQVRFVQKRKIYNENKRVIPAKAWNWWIKNSNLDNIDSIRAKAISLKHTNLRAFPTATPAYRDPWKSTEGFPFDYNQNSELHINVPLYLSHYSLDKKWAFVHAGHAFGWVKISDITLVDRVFMRNFQTGKYSVIVKDDSYLHRDGKRWSILKIGTIFPISRRTNQPIVGQKTRDGYATIKYVKRPSGSILAQKPVKFTPRNVAYISQQFRNEPYGWGGKLATRDCSATTRDFMGVFGIYLDRNSAKQSKNGTRVRIKGLPKASKKAAIIKYAKPFRSLLYVPGHIGLYLGNYKGEPIIMHTYWGVRLNNWDKYTLARTIITTTEPAKEIKNIREKSKLINTLKYIVNF